MLFRSFRAEANCSVDLVQEILAFCLSPELLIPGIPVIQKLENDRSEFIEHFAENNHDFDVIDDRRIDSALARLRK